MDILRNPMFTSLFVIILISSFGLQAFESIYSIMATINFGFTTSEIAIVITVSGILALICQLFFFDAIVQKIGEMGLIQLTFLQVPFYCRDCLYKNNLVVVFSTFIVF